MTEIRNTMISNVDYRDVPTAGLAVHVNRATIPGTTE